MPNLYLLWNEIRSGPIFVLIDWLFMPICTSKTPGVGEMEWKKGRFHLRREWVKVTWKPGSKDTANQ